MLSILLFSVIAAALVFIAGRKDAARDPRLSVTVLVLLLAFPLFRVVLPKWEILPEIAAGSEKSGISWLMIGWGMGAGLFLMRLAFAALGLAKWHRRSVLIGRRGRVEIRELGDLHGPVAAGVFHPVIYVPKGWEELSAETRQMVLSHEMQHHVRRDPLLRWVIEIVRAIHWYQPLVHWMARRWIDQCEYACDAAVLKQGVAPRRYAGVLCEFAERKNPAFSFAMAEAGSLEKRIRRMVSATPQRSRWLGVYLALGMMAALALTLVTARGTAEMPISQEEVQMRLSANPFPGN
ncbi:MAG: M56 family metallopeptidase [Luteolibacter sp.]